MGGRVGAREGAVESENALAPGSNPHRIFKGGNAWLQFNKKPVTPLGNRLSLSPHQSKLQKDYKQVSVANY